eukprot:scaffold115994_cov85-Attheya_sp.AAC.1
MHANHGPGLEPHKGAGSISSWEEIMGNQWRKQWIIVGNDEGRISIIRPALEISPGLYRPIDLADL